MNEEEREFQELVEKYERMVASGVDEWFDAEDLMCIASWYEDREEYDKLKEVTFRAYRIFPQNEEVVSAVANYYVNESQYDKAENVLEQYLKDHDSNDIKALLAGICVESDKKIGKARKIIESLIGQSDDRPYYHYVLGRIYLTEGNYEKAEHEIGKAIEEHDDDWSVLTSYVRCAVSPTLFESVCNNLRKATDENPYNDMLWLALGMVYTDAHRFDEALECADYAVAINDEQETAHALKANIYIGKSDTDSFVKESLKAAKYAQEPYTYYENVGKAYLFKDDHENALKFFKKALQYESVGVQLPYSNFGCVQCMLLAGNAKKVETCYKKVMSAGYAPDQYLYFADSLRTLGFLNMSEQVLYFLIENEKNEVGQDAIIMLSLVKADMGDIFGAIHLLETCNPDKSLTQDYNIAMIEISCRDRAFISYTKKALRNIFSDYSGMRRLQLNYPELMENVNFKQCLNELTNE